MWFGFGRQEQHFRPGDSGRSSSLLLPVRFPAFTEASQFCLALLPADVSGVRPLAPLASLRTELQITADIVQPSQQNGAAPIEIRWDSSPHRCQGARLAEAALVSLRGRVVVRMHHHGFGAVNYFVALGPAPAGVFVIFGVLHFF